MTTTTSITLDLDEYLPDGDAVQRLEDRFRAYCTRDLDRPLDGDLIGGWDGNLDVSDHHLAFWTNTKWVLEGSEGIARAMSGAYPNAAVTWTNTWDDEDGGEEQTVFRAGAPVAEREQQLVPKNLDTLVRDLEAAMKRRGHERNTGPAVREAAAALIAAYRA